jgi:hypothetical protein
MAFGMLFDFLSFCEDGKVRGQVVYVCCSPVGDSFNRTEGKDYTNYGPPHILEYLPLPTLQLDGHLIRTLIPRQ